MTDQMNVPKLRFGEFNEALVRKTLEEVTEKIQDGTHFSPPLDEEGTCLYLTSKNIRNGFMLLDDISYISELEHKKIYKRCDVKKGDVLLTKDGASTGNCCINTLDSEFSLLSSVAFIRANANHHNDFIYQSIASQAGQKLIRGSISGQAITRITLTKLRNFKFYFPTLPEQQKIASFLSKVDEKIALLTKKKDKLTEYKKGVMQQLFNSKWDEQDGQLTFIPPTLRFKADDGSEFPDWVEKKFGDCFDFFTTNSLSRDRLSYDTGMVKNIHYGDIHTKFRSVFKPEQEIVPYITDLDDTKKIKAQSYCQNGDLVFADASEDYADIGKCIEVRELGNLKLVAGLHTHLARPKEKFATGYQAYLQKSWRMRYQIMRIAQGTKVLGISTKQLATISLPVPCYEEQEKIAAFLTSLDSKIECLEFELDKSKEWKKGLLQQMFV